MNEKSQLDEMWLIGQIVKRDQTALAKLYDCYIRVLFSFVFKILGSVEESEEVVLDVFSQVWETAHQYDSQRGSVDAWLFLLARSRALDRLRVKKRQSKVIQNSMETLPIQSSSQIVTPNENVLILERRERLITALNQLPPEQKKVLELAYFQGFTYQEIASATGTSFGTVKTRLRLGLKKLRTLFPH